MLENLKIRKSFSERKSNMSSLWVEEYLPFQQLLQCYLSDVLKFYPLILQFIFYSSWSMISVFILYSVSLFVFVNFKIFQVRMSVLQYYCIWPPSVPYFTASEYLSELFISLQPVISLGQYCYRWAPVHSFYNFSKKLIGLLPGDNSCVPSSSTIRRPFQMWCWTLPTNYQYCYV